MKTGSTEKAVSLLQERIVRERRIPADLPAFAKHHGYTLDHLRWSFRRQTGSTMGKLAQESAVAHGARLLRETDRPVADVAAESGYATAAHFGALFRREYGTSPGAYRRRTRGDPPAWGPRPAIRESFHRRTKRWTVLEGEWTFGPEGVTGEAPDRALLRLERPIPDGFVLDCDLRLDPLAPGGNFQGNVCVVGRDSPPPLRLSFHHGRGDCHVGSSDRMVAFGRSLLAPGRWTRVRATVDRRRVALSAAGGATLECEIPFPVGEIERPRLALEAFFAKISCRDLRLYPLPSPGRGTPESEGDAARVRGDLVRAIGAYRRQTADPDVAPRLCVKIAQCCEELGNRPASHLWLRRCRSLPVHRPWTTLARLGLARLEGEEAYVEELRRLLSVPQDRMTAFLAAAAPAGAPKYPGSPRQALRVAETLHRFQRNHRLPADLSGERVEANVQLQRYGEAARLAAEHARLPGVARDRRAADRLMEAYAVGMDGQTKRAISITKEVLADDPGARMAFVARASHALALRAAGRFESAAVLLGAIVEEAPSATDVAYGLYHRAVLLELLGRQSEAGEAASRAAGTRTEYGLCAEPCVHIIREEPGVAGKLLLDPHRELPKSRSNRPVRLAAHLLRAIEQGEEGERQAFRRIAREPGGAPSWGAVASFHAGKADRIRLDAALSDLPVAEGAFVRPDFLYLEGLLLERRGDRAAAAHYYRRAVTGDPTREWGAVLAKRRLARYGRTTNRAR